MMLLKLTNKFAGAGLVSAFAASLCCITPVIALFAGTGSIAATFTWISSPCLVFYLVLYHIHIFITGDKYQQIITACRLARRCIRHKHTFCSPGMEGRPKHVYSLCRHCFRDKRHQFFFLAFKTFCKEIIHYLFIFFFWNFCFYFYFSQAPAFFPGSLSAHE